MTADNYAELVARLQDLAPCVDDITGPSSVVEIAAAKALREAGDAITALVKERKELYGDLNTAHLERDAKLCSQCPRTPELDQLRVELARVREAMDKIKRIDVYVGAGARDSGLRGSDEPSAPVYAYRDAVLEIIDAALAGKGEGEKHE